ncbi:hypothetical protein [Microcoleus sp. CAWBG58]|nr:hypothetical protein [Microcoleus sp. CAWBG58]
MGFNGRVFCGWAIGFFVDERSNLREMCDRVFGGWAIGFLVDGGDRVFG